MGEGDRIEIGIRVRFDGRFNTRFGFANREWGRERERRRAENVA